MEDVLVAAQVEQVHQILDHLRGGLLAGEGAEKSLGETRQGGRFGDLSPLRQRSEGDDRPLRGRAGHVRQRPPGSPALPGVVEGQGHAGDEFAHAGEFRFDQGGGADDDGAAGDAAKGRGPGLSFLIGSIGAEAGAEERAGVGGEGDKEGLPVDVFEGDRGV